MNFRVSCGPQHILFSDPRKKVDTGFLQTINLVLGVEKSTLKNETKCMTLIKINDTVSMRGEQQIDSIPNKPSTIYFGQMVSDHDNNIDLDIIGFQGCMSDFKVKYHCNHSF